jgi:hypothetical protein
MTTLNIDCLILIFYKMNKNSLYSCLLVNKEWCNVVVPILWKKYSWRWSRRLGDKVTRRMRLYNTILSCLPSSSKQLLSDNNIKLPSTILLKEPLFNYISFCKFPNAVYIIEIVKMVFESFNTRRPKQNLFEQEIYKLFISQCRNVKKLCWSTSQPLLLLPGASTCFSRLYSLSINATTVGSNSLYEVAQIYRDFGEIIIDNCFQDIPGLISLIEAQRNLKRVRISPNNFEKKTCRELGEALLKKSDTIDFLGLGSISIIPPSFLTSFANLKGISITNHEEQVNITEIIQFEHYLSISEFPDLERLEMLIKKTHGNISGVAIISDAYKDTKDITMFIEAIVENCPKIRALRTHIEPKYFINIKQLLLNCKKLEGIWFDSLDTIVGAGENGDELLDILTKFSPSTLTKIYISRDWKYSIDSFEKFFESCRERRLRHFGFVHGRKNYITKDHEEIIKKYIKEGVILKSNIDL